MRSDGDWMKDEGHGVDKGIIVGWFDYVFILYL